MARCSDLLFKPGKFAYAMVITRNDIFPPCKLENEQLVCFGVAGAKEAISGDVQLVRRFQEYCLPRWKANEEFQALAGGILRTLPLRLPSVLSARALKRILQSADGITAQIFAMLHEAAEMAIRSEGERIDDELMEQIHPRGLLKGSNA